MAWWTWIILGFLLVLGEMLTPGGFYLLFFGIGALVVGLLTIFGMAGPAWMEWLLFSVISVACVAFFRKPLVRKLSAQGTASGVPTVDTDTLVGEVAVAVESIATGAVGRVEMRGSAWQACNRGAQALASGQRCVVERVEGLMLDVRAQ
ncbi:MAG TPA: NfeD family protein [Terriglobales bacterium]|jgi:membrane protein implicated in regulation of membrane protease activity